MRSRLEISLMGPIGQIGQIGLIGRREDAELQDGQRPEGKESGFRSLESIWTEDGGMRDELDIIQRNGHTKDR